MKKEQSSSKKWDKRRIGITGANGSLGRSLAYSLRKKGAYVIGITHRSVSNESESKEGPNEWVSWKCGEESYLDKTLENLDILILNHGINPQANINSQDLNEALEINALSTWRLIQRFEDIIFNDGKVTHQREIWVNTSEAEIQPALSPGYEISKRLIGQLVSIKWSNLNQSQRKILKLRKLVLGPFKSDLNPLGILDVDFVANQIIRLAQFRFDLIIVSPNPLTYLIMPLSETLRFLYYLILRKN